MESRVLLHSASTFDSLSHLRKLPRECGSSCNNNIVSFVSARPVGESRSRIWGRQLQSALLLESSNLRGKPDHICAATSSSPAGGSDSAREAKIVPVGFVEKYPALFTGFFFFMWYFLNVIFNIINKKIYNYFLYPYFVSVVHLFVEVVYCLVSWVVGLPKRVPIDSNLLKLLIPVVVCHALGHMTSNVSFAGAAVSFTHTIKALEPFFNDAASQFILGQSIPFTLWLSLAPVVLGNKISTQTDIGTSIAIAGVAIYSYIKAKMEEEKQQAKAT